ncbi:MAG: bifunctional hydroxymethylpyrimidine kinase/phosphomethylpyrimidine kinase [Ilumatobacteraceae bacterium]|nr:bifunctional hydroxymethylpyrimidine kinase/phosphomethylpyrimidine kinase [Ilumatobacteraceae bacterium]
MSERMVIVVGAINVDLVVAAPRLPGPGETVVGDGLQTFGGGKGANAAVAAARAGATVRLIGAVGDDDTGVAALAELRNEGVDVSDVAVLAGESTGVALIVVDDRGENQIAVGAGANAAITVDHINRCLGSALPSAGCVLVSTEIPPVAIAAAVEAATAAGVVCLLNPAPVIPVVVELLSRGPIVTPNGSELHDLTTLLGGNGAASPEDAASRVVAISRQPVVVTQGADGVLLITSGSIRRVPAPSVNVRDTTGAGDTFNGVLAARLAAGDDLTTAVPYAVAAAALSVTEVGARGGMPTAAAIEAAMP